MKHEVNLFIIIGPAHKINDSLFIAVAIKVSERGNFL